MAYLQGVAPGVCVVAVPLGHIVGSGHMPPISRPLVSRSGSMTQDLYCVLPQDLWQHHTPSMHETCTAGSDVAPVVTCYTHTNALVDA